MKKTLLLLLPLLLLTLGVKADFFTDADAFLKKHVVSGQVDYEAIKAEPTELNALVKTIGSFTPGSGDAGKAFWLNAYNILVIKNVVDHYPIAKPLDVPGFFDKVTFKIAGSTMTLSDIENKKVRPTYKDARVHFALVCAAKSCPPLMTGAFLPSKVESQLETLTKTAMNSKSFIKVNDATKTVEISQILDWYKDDFLAVTKTQLDYVNKYRTTPIPTTYKVGFYEYNWALNVKKN